MKQYILYCCHNRINIWEAAWTLLNGYIKKNRIAYFNSEFYISWYNMSTNSPIVARQKNLTKNIYFCKLRYTIFADCGTLCGLPKTKHFTDFCMKKSFAPLHQNNCNNIAVVMENLCRVSKVQSHEFHSQNNDRCKGLNCCHWFGWQIAESPCIVDWCCWWCWRVVYAAVFLVESCVRALSIVLLVVAREKSGRWLANVEGVSRCTIVFSGWANVLDGLQFFVLLHKALARPGH